MKKNHSIPLTRPTLPSLSSISSQISEILKSGMVTENKFVDKFEKSCKKYLQVKHAVAVNSGTLGLILAIKCLGLKGEVIMPSFTYSSGGHALLWCGLRPAFVDIQPDSFNIDPEKIEEEITTKTCAIMPTHVFGNPCDIEGIDKIAKKYNLKVIYDASHAFGSLYDGRSIANFGHSSVYSFTPTKVLTTAEGGLVVTSSKALSDKLRIAKLNGDTFDRNKEFLGLTSRMSEFHAIIGLENIKLLKSSLNKRLRIVKYYKKRLSLLKGLSFQKIDNNSYSVFKDLTILVDPSKAGFTRDKLLDTLKRNKIQAKVYFDPPLHKKVVYKDYRNLDLPQTEYVHKNIISLPLYSNMPFEAVDRICDIIKKQAKNI